MIIPGLTDGFVRAADGTISTFEPQARAKVVFPFSINAKGAITGFYRASIGGEDISFVRSGTGKSKRFNIPEASQTDAYSINDKGVVAGYFADSDGNSHGFIRTP